MRREFYYILARGEDYGEGFICLDGEMDAVIRPTPHFFEHKGSAELVAEHFMMEWGGKAVVRRVWL
ncbi:MAG: hypothetical protein LBC18_10775 [Opitutaceae bacterium]|jgi:hypothetical protein|nr:hypothetical protein [Opitutaceae bacterium]